MIGVSTSGIADSPGLRLCGIKTLTRGSLAKKNDNVFAMQKQSVPKRI